jgi:hypothetical protein
MAKEPVRKTVTYEELAYSTMLQVQALVELPEEKGVLTQREILALVKRLQAQAAKRPT